MMMDALDSIDPYSRPARRTQWIVSTLAYHYGLDRGVENEIIVLATGLDQYLQEIFHHLDYQGAGKVTAEDFNILCEILGLNKDSEEESSSSTSTSSDCSGGVGVGGVSAHVAGEQLTFRNFHAKLCGYFSAKGGCQYESGRLLVGKDSEHIETQIRLRSPLRRRAGRQPGRGAGGPPSAQGCRQHGSCTRECYEEIVALEEAEDRVSKLEDENASLRELIEDMRAALQSSDARCLALQVGLWKSHSQHKLEEGCFVAHQKQVTANHTSNGNSLLKSSQSDLKELQNIIDEIELLRSSRDQQVDEIMLCNQRLEQELWSSKETVAALEDSNQALKSEQAGMRRKVEEARQVLLSSVEKVKELETQANHVPALERRILQLESELLFLRSEASKLQATPCSGAETQPLPPPPPPSVTAPVRRSWSDWRHDRCSPTGRAVTTPDKMEEHLFRSVEGQAASDEEEDKWSEEQQRRVEEVKRILSRLSCCGERCHVLGCDNMTLKKLTHTLANPTSEESSGAVVQLLERVSGLQRELEQRQSQEETEQTKDCVVKEPQQQLEETELLHMELHALETERVRLSLVEEKLVDILQLLQQLRDLDVSRRSLGKILLSTLESCSDPQHGKAHIMVVLNALYHELAACEILSTGGPSERECSQQSLITSC